MASATLSRPATVAHRATSNLPGGQVLSVTWRIDGSPNVAEVAIPKKRFHEFRQHNAGKPIWIKIRKNFVNHLIFHGWITSRYFDFGPNSENVTVVCQGPRWKLGADFLKGRWILNKDGQYRVLYGLPCVFNEILDESETTPGNGAISKATDGVRPFSLNPRDSAQTTQFSINEMLWYCYVRGRLDKAPLADVIGEILTLTEFGVGANGDLKIYDVNVDGLTILDAFSLVFRKAGMKWWCRPVSETQSQVRAFISGANSDAPRKYLYLADVSAGVSPTAGVTLYDVGTTTNNTESGRMNEDFSAVANEVFGYGARKIFQAEFTLRPGWDATVWETLRVQPIETVRAELREQSSSDWETYKDVGRKWILDEQGAVTGVAHDFSSLFGHQEWAQIMRPFLAFLVGETEDGMPEMPGMIEVKNPISGEWEKLEANVRILEDEAGILIEGGELSAPLMVEQDYSVLVAMGAIGPGQTPEADPQLASEIRLTLAVTEDKALEKSTEEDDAQMRKVWLVGLLPNADSSRSTIERRMAVIADQEYQTDNVDAIRSAKIEADLQALVNRKREENQDPRVSSSFSIPWICTTYEPGDLIVGIRGRDLYFTGQVVEVRFEFEGQRTELVLEDLRLAEY